MTGELIDRAADVDTQAIAHLDFGPGCEIQIEMSINIFGHRIPLGMTPECHEPAVAMMRCRVCATTGLVCDNHRTAIASSSQTICLKCSSVGPGLQLMEFLPLPGATS